MTKNTAENWKREKTPAKFNENAKGYPYLSDGNIQWWNFMLTITASFSALQTKWLGYVLMGGNMGVRKPESPSKPPMIFGPDESIFN